MKINRCTGTYKSFFGMLLLVILCLGFSGQAFAEGSYQVTEMQMQGTITTDSALNVRRGPGKDYDVLTKVSNDTVLTITGQADNGWYQVEINGETGYVSDKYVDAQEVAKAGELEKEEGEPEEGYRGLNQSPYVKKLLVISAVIIVILVMIVLTIKGLRRDDEDDEYDDEDEDDEYDDEDADGGEYDDGDEDDGEYDDEDDDDGEYDDEDDDDGGEYDDRDEDDEDEDDDDEDDEPVRRPRTKKQPSQQNKNKKQPQQGKKPGAQQGKKQTKKKEYVLREEDYRVQIDPSFFEDKEPIEQPAMVTGYLERKKIEEEALKRGLNLSDQEIRAYASEHGKAEDGAGKQKELDEAMAKLSELQKEIERLKKQ